MQPDLISPREASPLSISVRSAAEQIDPAAYREVAMALVAVDAPIGAVARLAYAIALARGQECQRDFISEYAQLLWDSIQEQIPGRSGSAL
jgi:hypothetical protein